MYSYVVLDNCAIISHFVAVLIRLFLPRMQIPLVLHYEMFITYEMTTRFTTINVFCLFRYYARKIWSLA
jgi:hypothetical protein